jgi:hypothetical protein
MICCKCGKIFHTVLGERMKDYFGQCEKCWREKK